MNVQLRTEEHYIRKAKFPVFDMHTHWGPIMVGADYENKYDTGAVVENLKSYNICGVFNPDIIQDESYERMQKKLEGHTDFVQTLPSVDITKCEEPGFAEYVEEHFKAYANAGVRAVKLWKNMTLYHKDKNGKFIPLDDERYECLFSLAGKYKLPILIHVGDPHCLFTPVDENNEYYDLLCDHPEWVFVGDDYFTFDQHMQQQENVVASHPDTTFVIAHIGSCGEDLSRVDELLGKYPNTYIDIAARLSEIGRQPYTARKLFMKYPDRIMFGTDFQADFDPEMYYPPYFRFLETFDEYFDYMGEPHQNDYGRWKIYGIGLPDEVLKKVYYENAARVFNL